MSAHGIGQRTLKPLAKTVRELFREWRTNASLRAAYVCGAVFRGPKPGLKIIASLPQGQRAGWGG